MCCPHRIAALLLGWCLAPRPYLLAEADVVTLRDPQVFLDPVHAPDFFFDLAPSAAEVLAALRAVPPYGERYEVAALDEMLPVAPMMTPLLLWRTSEMWDGRNLRFNISLDQVSTLYIDIGAHEWSKFLPRLREEPDALLVCVEPTRAAFLELYRRLKMDYEDVLPRVVLLPVALTREPRVPWGFRVLHTNDFLQGECNSLLAPDEAVGHPCAAAGPHHIVAAMSLDVLLGLLLRGAGASSDVGDDGRGGGRFGVEVAAAEDAKVFLKIDAQGADLEIFETLREMPKLFTHLREVQMEVNAQIYEGQPSRRQIFDRMRLMGFGLRWDLAQVSDAGEHEVVRGCYLVASEPRTDDCFFKRLQADPHLALADHLLARPLEILRLNEGTRIATPQQLSILLDRHFAACPPGDRGGQAFQCLAGILENHLAPIFAIAGTVWGVQPASSLDFHHDGDEDWPLSLVFAAVVEFLLPMLLLVDWEETHDAGAAALAFTLLVETGCRAHPSLCRAERWIDGEHNRREAEAPVCTSLRNCFLIFAAPSVQGLGVAAVVTRPDVFLPVFRAAQVLAAPRCVPREWIAELGRPEGASWPTIRAADGLSHVTAIAIDSAVCGLEITLVALVADGEDYPRYHGMVANLTGMIRPLGSMDIRIPTDGEDWVFDCLFPDPGQPGRELRALAETYSFTMMQEVPGFASSPVISIRCSPPPELLADSEGQELPLPAYVRLERSLRANIEMPEVGLRLPLRRFERPQVRTALCTQQVWDLPSLERAMPGHAEFWLRYHVEVLGIDEVYLYDLDGSFADLPAVADLRAAGRLVYEDAFAKVPPLDEVFEKHGFATVTAHFTQTMVQHHCWQQAKHNADWVISISHGWDMFLFSPIGEPLSDLLDRLPSGEMNFIEGVRYGWADGASRGEATKHSNVLGRFPYHNDLGLRVEDLEVPPERILVASPRLIDGALLSNFVPRSEAPLMSNMMRGLAFSGPMMRNINRVSVREWRGNHYVQLFGTRAMLYRHEEDIPELRAFTHYDAMAASLGEHLAAAGSL